MPTEKCQLNNLTIEEMVHIERYAPEKVRITTTGVNLKINVNDCRTVQDIYVKAEKYRKMGKTDDGLELMIYANELLLEQVERLARELMERVLQVQGVKEKEVRKLLVVVIDYQKVLKYNLEKDMSMLDSKGSRGSGYLLFKDLTDEEISFFWNGY